MGKLKKPKSQPLNRKQQRKEQRKQKKVKRNEHNLKRSKVGLESLQKTAKPANNAKNKSTKPMKKPPHPVEHHAIGDTSNKVVLQKQNKNANIVTIQSEKKQLKTLQREMSRNRKRHLLDANEEEDRNIKRLAKQLKLNRRKSKSVPKSFAVDGLDYLLEVCDSETVQSAAKSEQQLMTGNEDFEEDFDLMTGSGNVRKNSKKSRGVADKELNSEDEDDELARELQGDSDSDDLGSDFDEEEDDVDTDSEPVTKSSKGFKQASDDDDMHSESEEEDHVKITQSSKKAVNVDSTMNTGVKSRKKSSSPSKTDELLSSDDELSEGDFEGMSDEGSVNDSSNSKVNKKQWEDIYGRLRDEKGNVIVEDKADDDGKYLPPALRVKLDEGADALKHRERIARLRKQLKGLLNRLAESNMHNISNQIETLYMNNSRNDMNDTLTSIIVETLVSPVLSSERLLTEHVLLIVILHANVGTEVGAHFLEEIVKLFDKYMQPNQDNPDNKSLDNVVSIMSQLYNFKVIHAQLVYQMLNKLGAYFTESKVGCIILALKQVGFSLRKDDPASLKVLILDLQKQAASAKSTEIDNARINFFLDILLAIKNNNVSKIPNYDTTYSEHLKKSLKGVIRKGYYVSQLHISIDDLLKADQKGKWWIVGSAWIGNIDNAGGPKKDQEEIQQSETTKYSDKLLELARKQRMNTDTRRNIFCILMSAEDYLDAFEKILHLGLKNQQEREIINVILHCCLQEQAFNKYYAVLCNKFCEYNRKFQMMIKYSVWDKLKALSNASGAHIANLAKLLTFLFLEKALPISVLKVMGFSDLDKVTLRLTRQILLGILLCDDKDKCLDVFAKLSQSQPLKVFKDSLRVFIHHFLVRNLNTEKISSEQVTILRDRADAVDRLLAVNKKSLY